MMPPRLRLGRWLPLAACLHGLPFAACLHGLPLAACLLLVGCAQQNSQVVQGQLQDIQRQTQTLTAQNQELLARASKLDQDNQDLQTLIAQTRQQSRLKEDEVAALRDQLRSAGTQLAKAREELDSRAAQLAEALPKAQARASIAANSSLKSNLPTFDIPGVHVRYDGDVVRVEMPADVLFDPGDARLSQQAAGILDRVGGELSRTYPDRILGVEGHTDPDPPPPGKWFSNLHLSIARATSSADFLTDRVKVRPQQLFVVGHGANHPVVSNATPAGKQRNRRIELVVYPERYDGQ